MDFEPVLIAQRRKQMTENNYWQDKTACDYFDECLAKNPNKIALTDIRVSENVCFNFTYEQLNDLANKVAIALNIKGVKKYDVITCQLPNSWQFFALFLGCMKIGAVFNPVMHIFREHELEFMLKHGQSKAFVIPKEFRKFDHEQMALNMLPKLPCLEFLVIDGKNGENSFEELLELGEKNKDKPIDNKQKLEPDEVCQLIYTSGTTGEPKGVMHTSNTMYSNLVQFSKRLGLKSDDKILMASPMAHQTGFMYGMLLPFYLQCPVVTMDIWDKDKGAKIVEEEKITFTMASTPFLLDMANAFEESGRDPSSLRIFLSAGTAIPGAIVEKAAKILGAKIVSAWGMTENGAVTLTKPTDPQEYAVNSDGLPLDGMELQLRDHNGNVIEEIGKEGELYVRGCSNFGGYLKRPQWNNTDENGWFDTGDIARFDENKYIRICGRSKDIIIRGAENIPVIEVENVLFKHPSIQTIALVGYPDERLGEKACAFVIVKEGKSFDFNEMTRFLEENHLARQYFPERLEIRDTLPATASGKIQKFNLRKMLLELIESEKG